MRADALAEEIVEDVTNKVDAGFIELNRRLAADFVWYVSSSLPHETSVIVL
jgi:hypothetical protein